MQKLLLYGTLLLLIFVACGKDKFDSKPSIKLISIGPNPVPVGTDLNIDLEYTDKEGDVADSIFIRKIRTNKRPASGGTLRDSFYLQLPTDAPDKTKGIIRLQLNYNDYVVSATTPPNNESDSLIFKIMLQDKAKNKSDTLVTDIIVVERK